MTRDDRAATLDQIIETSTELRLAAGNERRTQTLADELYRLCLVWVAVN